MPSIQARPLPAHALLAHHARSGAYTDCFATEVPVAASHADYVIAFYTGRVFKLERWLLAWLARRPSTDAQARELAHGQRDAFSAWTVEARAPDQLLLCDFAGRTRSWLMVEPVQRADGPATRLYFGSAVVPLRNKATGATRMGTGFHALLGFHKLYSRVLLGAARARLLRSR